MKRLLKFGVLLLLTIGAFAVQTSFSTPVLEDVGMEYVDNMDVSDNAVLIVNYEMKVPVTAPLKYPMFVIECKISFVGNVSQEFEASDNFNLGIQDDPEKMLTNSNRQYELSGTIIKGLYRLEIGDRFSQNLKA